MIAAKATSPTLSAMYIQNSSPQPGAIRPMPDAANPWSEGPRCTNAGLEGGAHMRCRARRRRSRAADAAAAATACSLFPSVAATLSASEEVS